MIFNRNSIGVPKPSVQVDKIATKSLEEPKQELDDDFMMEGEEEEKDVFTVNTAYSRCERNPVKEV